MTTSARTIKHYTATVYIFTDTKPRKILLLHHRKHNVWNPPGGHQEAWENPVEAAIREVKEETGLDISTYLEPNTPIGKGQYLPQPVRMLEVIVPAHEDEPKHYHIDLQYHVTMPEQSVTHAEAEAHDIGWFTLAETEQLTTFTDVRQTLRQELTA
jgi:8-oxo-dGTP pyrophosphatase MutT (NUDIX family)